jgi:sterol desaturase/sphingolipid hydroxylase (fatty acid hydroxylase superfamily)
MDIGLTKKVLVARERMPFVSCTDDVVWACMSLSIAISLLLLALLVLLGVIEHLYPARRFEVVPGWRLKCLLFMPCVVAITTGLTIAMANLLSGFSLLEGDRLGIVGGSIIGILISEMVVYGAHRVHHQNQFLWRWVHQLHHSAERIDVFGSAYFHPFEIAEGVIVGLLMFQFVLGLHPSATLVAVSWQAFNGVFQHANIRTPQWLGYLLQRPESHAVHHERGVHAFNYANLSLWDIVFRTFRNPATWQGDVGFFHGSSQATFRMLRGENIDRIGPATK